MSPGSHVRCETPLLERTRREFRQFDLLVLAVVPVVLLGLFLAPERITDGLVLYYLEPSLPTAYASHFVHVRPAHLMANLVGYVLLAGVGYLLAINAGCRRFFLTAFVVIVCWFPFVLSGLNLAVPRNAISYGFSGINMALLGLLQLVLGEYVRRTLLPSLERRDVAISYFGTVSLIALVVVPLEPTTVGLAAVSTAVGGLYARGLASDDRLRTLARNALERPGYGELAVGSVVLIVSYVFVAFPGDVAYGASILNVYVHFLGYGLGFLGPYLLLEADALARSPDHDGDDAPSSMAYATDLGSP